MITFTVHTSHSVKEVHLKFSNGRLTSVVHNGHAYGIESISLSGFAGLSRDYLFDQTLGRAVSDGKVQHSSLDHVYMEMTIVFDEDIMLDMSHKRRRHTRQIRIVYKPHEREDHRG